MTERIEQVREQTDDGVSSKTSRVVETDTLESAPSTIGRIVWFIASVLIVLLLFRFVFILLGANAGNGFVDFIYTLSYPLAAPFFGIFSYSTEYGVSRFEFASLVAIAVYSLIAAGIVKLVTIRET